MNAYNNGKLIVIDGLDGSGKSTQFERILSRLAGKYNIMGISFPEYDQPSAALVKMYLAGEFSRNAADVNAYAASTFYAADRYASYKLHWEEHYKKGGIVLASRYVCSNAIHQTPKLPPETWDSFLDWLCDYEYEKLGLPRPDRTILLDIPEEVAQKRLAQRYHGDESRKDIHESNREYMRLCRRCALYAADRMGWETVSCCAGDGTEYTVEEITEKLLSIISEVIG